MRTLQVRSGLSLLGVVDVPEHMAADGQELVGTQSVPGPFSATEALPPIITQVRFPIVHRPMREGMPPVLHVFAGDHDSLSLRLLLGPWNFRPV